MIGISPLINTIQEYPWGSRTFLAELLGTKQLGTEPTNRPQAELWMGAHPKAPSSVSVGDHVVPLPEIISEDPEAILGRRTLQTFGRRLPFLFKVIAADAPLSIQAHPNRAQARAGFERENRMGLALHADNRNYRDDNHKPEIACALTELRALQGFRGVQEMVTLLGAIECPATKNLVDMLCRQPLEQGLQRFFTALMSLERDQARHIAAAVAGHARVRAQKTDARPEWELINTLAAAYPEDLGILGPLFLNLVVLKPQQALFQGSGQLHAYMGGAAIELMASSDNVVRGGLTHKHVDRTELLKIIEFEAHLPEPVCAQPTKTAVEEQVNPTEVIFPTSTTEFQLSRIHVAPERLHRSPARHEIELLICLAGSGSIHDESRGVIQEFGRGNSFLIPAAVQKYTIRGAADLYKAGMPRLDGLATA